MDNVYLQEAFKALDILNEEDFNLTSTDGISELKDFIDEDEKIDFVDIIDPEAETEEELKDDYIGDVVLDCCVCHSKLYKHPEEIVIDEEEGLVNIDEECPYCYSTDGYTIVGQIAPYEKVEEKEEEEEIEDSEDEEVEEKEEEKVEVEESLNELFGGNNNDVTAVLLYSPNNKDIEVVAYSKGKNARKIASDYIYKLKEKDTYDGRTLKVANYEAAKKINKNFMKTAKFLGEELTEDADISEYQKWVDFDMEKYGRISGITMKKIKNAGFSVVKDQYGEYEVIADRADECLKEHFEKVEIETDTEKMEMTADENGKVTVTTEPKTEEEEVIAPVTDETQEEINPTVEVETEEPVAETEEEVTEEEEEGTEDLDVNDFSEEEFDELGESYLKKVYENVNSFKTSSTKIKNNRLVVEGIIGFTSGKQKKTSFIFESKDIDKNNKVRFVGENLQLSKGRKAFTLRGNLNEGKFIAESLNYNYRTKDSNGNSTRLYGTVKVSKK